MEYRKLDPEDNYETHKKCAHCDNPMEDSTKSMYCSTACKNYDIE